MRKIIAVGMLGASLVFAGGELTVEERTAAIQQFEASRQKFLASLEGVTAEQWSKKTAPDRWSIAEVAEHITITESTIPGLVRKQILKTPAKPEREPEIVKWDARIRPGLLDRSKKASAPEVLKPAGKWATREALVSDFEKFRGETISYLKETNDPLRAHRSPHPVFGELDGYQWLLFLSAHCERHTLQIEEVKAQLR
jgi:hypothetical protein